MSEERNCPDCGSPMFKRHDFDKCTAIWICSKSECGHNYEAD